MLDNIINGYIGGHGLRLRLKPIISSQEDIDMAQLRNKSLDFGEVFDFSTFELNPNEINVSNSYGWSDVQDGNGGGNLYADYSGRGTPQNKQSNSRQFDKRNNKKTYAVAGLLYPNALDLLSGAIVGKKNPFERLKMLDSFGVEGVDFYLQKPSDYGVDVIGIYNILQLDYKMTNFIYKDQPNKVAFSMLLAEVVEV